MQSYADICIVHANACKDIIFDDMNSVHSNVIKYANHMFLICKYMDVIFVDMQF